MFQRFLSFLGLTLLFSCIYGCSDEYMSQPVKTVFFTPPIWLNNAPADSTIGPVPEDLANLLWGDLDDFMAQLKDVMEDGILETDKGPVHDMNNLMPEYLIDRICQIKRQRAYYQKYIDAGGVAIMGDAFLEDRYFYATRDVVLGMTSKMPELREYLSPIDTERENLTGKIQVPYPKFRMILVHPNRNGSIPPPDALPRPADPLGWCKLDLCVSTVQIINSYSLSMKVFIHEFAHALNFAINLVDATFEERLKAAYEDAKANNDSYWGRYDGGANVAEQNFGEYWAWCSAVWFTEFSFPTRGGEAAHARFRELDPLMYALLDDIYDFQYLGDIEVRLYR